MKKQQGVNIIDKLQKALIEGIEITIGVINQDLPLKLNITCRIINIDKKKNLIEISIIKGREYVECILEISWVKFIYLEYEPELNLC